METNKRSKKVDIVQFVNWKGLLCTYSVSCTTIWRNKKILYLKKVLYPLGVPFDRLVWLNVLIYNLISNHFFVNKYINTSNLIVWYECVCNIRVVLFCELFVLSFVFLLLSAYTYLKMKIFKSGIAHKIIKLSNCWINNFLVYFYLNPLLVHGIKDIWWWLIDCFICLSLSLSGIQTFSLYLKYFWNTNEKTE